ncbi:MAG: hypothetical protein M1426_04375 [Patescibacteria group bacterium]|nr:hypothetical protein [Patescibacteria group bacterium]
MFRAYGVIPSCSQTENEATKVYVLARRETGDEVNRVACLNAADYNTEKILLHRLSFKGSPKWKEHYLRL